MQKGWVDNYYGKLNNPDVAIHIMIQAKRKKSRLIPNQINPKSKPSIVNEFIYSQEERETLIKTAEILADAEEKPTVRHQPHYRPLLTTFTVYFFMQFLSKKDPSTNKDDALNATNEFYDTHHFDFYKPYKSLKSIERADGKNRGKLKELLNNAVNHDRCQREDDSPFGIRENFLALSEHRYNIRKAAGDNIKSLRSHTEIINESKRFLLPVQVFLNNNY